jgi:hypothetical protein
MVRETKPVFTRLSSYGLTTMRNRHAEIKGSTITFKFQGKSGIRHTIDINDRRLARIIQRCQDIPGYELFHYIDIDGEHRTIDSADVNEYLREISNEDFHGKRFSYVVRNTSRVYYPAGVCGLRVGDTSKEEHRTNDKSSCSASWEYAFRLPKVLRASCST